jgi:hypothetical protein|tara:strand:- start:1448 stop:1720 length:273 start_codon:yes stop_codon:yes gene_type:complete
VNKNNAHNERIYYNREGMIIPNSDEALHIIWELEHEMKNPRNDGWTGSDMKRRLWDIKMRVDKALVNAPEYVGDEPYEDRYIIERIKGNV